MGKKSKSSRRGAAARPATNNEGSTSRSAGASSLEVPTVVDWKTLDLSKCCLCHVSFKDLPNYTYWLRYGTFILKTCCGSKICCFCRKKHNGKIDAAERRVNELMSSPRPYFNQVAEAQRVFNGLLKCPACKADHLTDEGQVEAAQRLAKDKHPIALDIVGCHYINGTRLLKTLTKESRTWQRPLKGETMSLVPFLVVFMINMVTLLGPNCGMKRAPQEMPRRCWNWEICSSKEEEGYLLTEPRLLTTLASRQSWNIL